GIRSTTEREVAGGTENQVAIESAILLQLTAPKDGSDESIIGTERLPRCRNGKQFRHGSRGEELVRVLFEQHLASTGITDQQSPVCVSVLGARKNRFNVVPPGGRVVPTDRRR